MDLLPYILPFGIRVSVIRATSIPREIPLQIASSTALRKVFADVIDSELNLRPHPLGLANISDDNGQLSVDYSNSYFVKPEDDTAVAGMFGTSPIISFDPDSASSSSTSLDDKEENT
jgi:hypothetical protein